MVMSMMIMPMMIMPMPRLIVDRMEDASFQRATSFWS
jgi:hypothetical protein